ncbi:MAG TPA: GPP34 family phosphoprotein [Pseudonocardiaceae bacterium]|jgi:hypothetical protein|nr:GPP34 family phosphoprotein [Pseudonocardiaceae bacterium]
MPTRSQPKTLPAKLYLLACSPDTERLSSGRELGVLLRGAALTDLSLRKYLRDESGKVRASGTKRSGDPVLDELLREISEAPARPWSAWIRRGGRSTVRAIEAQLESAGLIGVRQLRMLGIFPVRRISLSDPELVAELREGARKTLLGEEKAEDVDKFDAALVSLASAGALRAVLSRKEERGYASRINELTARCDAVVPVVQRVIKQVKSARAAAYAGG